MNLGVVIEHFDGYDFGAMGKTNIAQLCKWTVSGVKESHDWAHCNQIVNNINAQLFEDFLLNTICQQH
jgi:hypothetical protein